MGPKRPLKVEQKQPVFYLLSSEEGRGSVEGQVEF